MSKNFRVIVKVGAEPLKALQKLGQVVTGNDQDFVSVDLDWIAKCEYITAVPVEIALSMEERAVLMKHVPTCEFIVTGIPANKVKRMVDRYGYTVCTPIVNVPEARLDDEKIPIDERPNTAHSLVAEEGKELKATNNEDSKFTKEFWINGKRASEKEFKEAMEKFKDIEDLAIFRKGLWD